MTSHSATVSYYADRKTGGGGNPFLRAASTVATFFGDLTRASEAAATYQRLSHLSDEALAKRGLTREELPAHAFRTAFSH